MLIFHEIWSEQCLSYILRNVEKYYFYMNKVPFLRGNIQNQNALCGGSHESLNSCFIINFMISV